MLVLAAFAVTFGVLAKTEQQRAEAQRITALARSLGANARLLYDRSPTTRQTAALLTVEALRREPSPQVDATARLILSKRTLLPMRVFRHPASVSSIAVTPDGQFLASHQTSSRGGFAIVFEMAGGEEVARLPIRSWDNNPISFSHSGHKLAVPDGETLWLWEWKSANPPIRIGAHGQNIVFSHNDEWLADVGEDRITVFNVSDGSLHRTLKSSDAASWAWLEFSPRAPNVLVAGTGDGQIIFFDVYSGLLLRSFFATHIKREIDPNTPAIEAFSPGPKKMVDAPVGVRRLLLSPDGGTLSVIDDDGGMGLWDVDGAEPKQIGAYEEGDFTEVAFGARGSLIASSNADGFIVVRDSRTGKQLASERLGSQHSVGILRRRCVRGERRGRERRCLELEGERHRGSHDPPLRGKWACVVRQSPRHGQPRRHRSHLGNALHIEQHSETVRWHCCELARMSPEGTILAVSTQANETVVWKPFADTDILSLKGRADCVEFDIKGTAMAVGSGNCAVVFDISDISAPQRLFAQDFPQTYLEGFDAGLSDSIERVVLLDPAHAVPALFEDKSLTEEVSVVDLRGGRGAELGSKMRERWSKRRVNLAAKKPVGPVAQSLPVGASGFQVDIALSPDGRKVAVAAFDWIWLYDAASGQRLARRSLGYEVTNKPFSEFSVHIESMWFDQHAERLLAITGNGVVWLWKLENDQLSLVGQSTSPRYLLQIRGADCRV